MVFFSEEEEEEEEEEEDKGKYDLLYPLRCDGELTQRLFEMLPVRRRTIDSGSDSTAGPLLADRRPSGTEADAATRPLTDRSPF
ncbi:Hypothetical protein SMAX5B_013845 [Scophthalmus maximus]|uniref:Uncharacterized protein n=1 Tax=Scophthalmus maximus TaxID=52904 RepID=A0A2U9CFS3_SCOMX|nr:Hypothetical protein SMAX5B_013845 [Scophthalmus maximus]KAF0031614.1 hypothetical protein F2P81_016169 [Scophthalmus maximus]